ncbi:hypothetical protein [Antiquaquibacter soli]|uniref:HEPN domain-containing protein n=1 Tax=Antiquaquibacter soli TaxID=3064523 RepID=A0ABT9BR36_9MICO|nr:hypothetical protein [Protaetiibacter sp. WY-16]MDO7883476.1 hypothetical protein [Protaetiibacter sp. WY-16]
MGLRDIEVRASQARAFLQAARVTSDFSDEVSVEAAANVIATNAVLAGIAAADAICGRALGVRSSSSQHSDALAILRRAHGGEAAAGHLRALLSLKNDASYEPLMITSVKAAAAIQHAERLVDLMERILR